MTQHKRQILTNSLKLEQEFYKAFVSTVKYVFSKDYERKRAINQVLDEEHLKNNDEIYSEVYSLLKEMWIDSNFRIVKWYSIKKNL